MQAHKLAANFIKIFPGSLVGPTYLKALRGPFPNIKMMSTGDVSIDNAADWFAADAIGIGAGNESCPTAGAKEGRFEDIVYRAKEFTKAVKVVWYE